MKTILVILCALMGYATGWGESVIEPGTAAPEFSLNTHDGETVTLSSFKGQKYVVLIFYPGDETPVCTQQLCEIRDDYSKFEQRGAVVFGVNPGSEKSHREFVEKNSFQFKLLIDTKGTVAKAYKTKGVLMNQRTVYVIDKEGNVVFAQRGKPTIDRILQSIPEHN